MTPIHKSLVLAAFVVVSLLGTIVYLTRSAPAFSTEADTPAARAEERHPSASAVREKRSARSLHRRPVSARERFAIALYRRFHQRGQAVTVEATGREATLLQMTWPEGSVDEQHMGQLKRADPFYRELRSHGFGKLILRVGERVVWTKDLEKD
jgi:hypothetical protein